MEDVKLSLFPDDIILSKKTTPFTIISNIKKNTSE